MENSEAVCKPESCGKQCFTTRAGEVVNVSLPYEKKWVRDVKKL